MIRKYCKIIQVFTINEINLQLNNKISGSRIIMDLIIHYTNKNEHNLIDKDIWNENVQFINDCLAALASCLRFGATANRFIKDKKHYVKYLIKILSQS